MSWKRSRDLPPTFHTGKHMPQASLQPPSPQLLPPGALHCALRRTTNAYTQEAIKNKHNDMVQTPSNSRKTEKPSLRGNTSEAGARTHTEDPGRSPEPYFRTPQTPKTPKSPSPLALRRLAQPVRLMGLIPGLFPPTSASRPLQHPITQCGPCQTTNPRAASGSRARSSQSQGDANVRVEPPFPSLRFQAGSIFRVRAVALQPQSSSLSPVPTQDVGGCYPEWFLWCLVLFGGSCALGVRFREALLTECSSLLIALVRKAWWGYGVRWTWMTVFLSVQRALTGCSGSWTLPKQARGAARKVQAIKTTRNKEHFKELCQIFVGSWITQRRRGAH